LVFGLLAGSIWTPIAPVPSLSMLIMIFSPVNKWTLHLRGYSCPSTQLWIGVAFDLHSSGMAG
jgi:hypothetical protein